MRLPRMGLLGFFFLLTLGLPLGFALDLNHSALMIIDMQPYFYQRGGLHESPSNQVKLNAVLKNQLEIIKKSKELNLPIFLVEYLRSGNTSDILMTELKNYPKFVQLTKDRDSLFAEGSEHALRALKALQAHNVRTIVVAGANGGACVYRTIKGALDLEFDVLAFNQGIIDFNQRVDFLYPYQDFYEDFDQQSKMGRAWGIKDAQFKEFSSIDQIFNFELPKAKNEIRYALRSKKIQLDYGLDQMTADFFSKSTNLNQNQEPMRRMSPKSTKHQCIKKNIIKILDGSKLY